MNCPRCQMPISNPNETFCPRCGYALRALQSETPTTSTPIATPTVPVSPLSPQAYPTPVLDGQQPPTGPFPGYGAPPSSSLYGPGMPPPPYLASYLPYSGYPPYPPYGVPAPGTTPLTMPPSWAPAAPPKRRNYVLVGLMVVLLVAVVVGGSAALYLVANSQHGADISLLSAGTPTAIATATRVENIYFQDPLTTNTYGWLNNSHCFFKNGGYHVTSNYLCFAPVNSVGDCEVSVQIRLVSGGSDALAGLVVHVLNTDTTYHSYYLFLIDSASQWIFLKSVNNVYKPVLPSGFSSAIKTGLGATNTLAVRNDGNHYILYVNGTTVGQADDSSYPYGYVGVATGADTEAVFNNFALGTPQG